MFIVFSIELLIINSCLAHTRYARLFLLFTPGYCIFLHDRHTYLARVLGRRASLHTGRWVVHQPVQAPSNAPDTPHTHQLTPIYPYPPRNPHARFSVPTCISLKRERSQDICWNTFKIEEPPTQQPNALKSVDRVSASCRALPSHEDFIF